MNQNLHYHVEETPKLVIGRCTTHTDTEPYQLAIWTVERKPRLYAQFSLHVNFSIITKLIVKNIYAGSYYGRLYHRGLVHSVVPTETDLHICVELATEEPALIKNVFNHIAQWLYAHEYVTVMLECVLPIPTEPQCYIIRNVERTHIYAATYMPKNGKASCTVDTIAQSLYN